MENNKDIKNENVAINKMKTEDPLNVNQINKSFLADPAPLGLAAFGFTTFLQSLCKLQRMLSGIPTLLQGGSMW